HEVVHTVQQQGATPTTQFKLDVSQPGDALEVEADRAAATMVRSPGASVGAIGRGPAALSRRPRSNVDASGDGMEVTDVPNVVQAGQAEAVDDGAGHQVQAGRAGYS